MVIIIFYSILTSVSQIHTFNNNLNDGEMITTHLMCTVNDNDIYDKNIMLGKNIRELSCLKFLV